MKDASPPRADRAAIFAGGAGARLGGVDKGGLEIGGEALWRRVVARIGPQADGMVVLAPARPDWMEEIDRAGWLQDAIALSGGRAGPAAGLVAALRQLLAEKGPEARLLTAPVDAPFAPRDLFARLEAARLAAGAAASLVHHEGGLHPVFGVWLAACAPDIGAAFDAGERALHRLAEKVGAVPCAAWAGVHPDPFFNINTPEDLSAAEAAISAPPG